MQILLDDDRYARLERAATREGRTMASIVHDAIDAQVGSKDEDRRRSAFRELLEEPLPAEPEPDWQLVKEEMLDARGRLSSEGPT